MHHNSHTPSNSITSIDQKQWNEVGKTQKNVNFWIRKSLLTSGRYFSVVYIMQARHEVTSKTVFIWRVWRCAIPFIFQGIRFVLSDLAIYMAKLCVPTLRACVSIQIYLYWLIPSLGYPHSARFHIPILRYSYSTCTASKMTSWVTIFGHTLSTRSPCAFDNHSSGVWMKTVWEITKRLARVESMSNCLDGRRLSGHQGLERDVRICIFFDWEPMSTHIWINISKEYHYRAHIADCLDCKPSIDLSVQD